MKSEEIAAEPRRARDDGAERQMAGVGFEIHVDLLLDLGLRLLGTRLPSEAIGGFTAHSLNRLRPDTVERDDTDDQAIRN